MAAAEGKVRRHVTRLRGIDRVFDMQAIDDLYRPSVEVFAHECSMPARNGNVNIASDLDGMYWREHLGPSTLPRWRCGSEDIGISKRQRVPYKHWNLFKNTARPRLPCRNRSNRGMRPGIPLGGVATHMSSPAALQAA